MKREWKCGISDAEVRAGRAERAREAQLIAEAERDAVRAFEDRRLQRSREVEEWAAWRARTRERMKHA